MLRLRLRWQSTRPLGRCPSAVAPRRCRPPLQRPRNLRSTATDHPRHPPFDPLGNELTGYLPAGKLVPFLAGIRIHTSWDTVFRSVRYAVEWGIVHRDLRGVEAAGIDEIQYQRGHRYLTLVYQIDGQIRRLLWVGQNRTKDALESFFDLFGDEILPTLKFVCSDMWQPYLDVIRARAGHALNILDRYHVMAKMNKAIDEIRAVEARRLKADGYEPVLTHSR